MTEATEEDHDNLEVILECAGTVAEWLMATNKGDFEKSQAVVDTWRDTNHEGQPLFLECIYDQLSAIEEGRKLGKR